METNGCLQQTPAGLQLIEAHNEAVRQGKECLKEDCPLLLCPLTSMRVQTLVEYVEDLERQIKDLQQHCYCHECPECSNKRGLATAV